MAQHIPLDEYIALGSLTSQDSLENSQIDPDWTEVTKIELNLVANTVISHPQSTENAVERLINARWVRLLSKRSSNVIFYRLYLLPDNVGRSSVSRHRRGLRSDVELLVSVINISADTWNGTTLNHTPFEPWAAAEEGSLFYIFNTLPSPDPYPESIQDRYTRLALHELLDTTNSIPGLRSPLYPYQARSAAAMIQQESTTEARIDPRYESRIGPDGTPYYFIPRELSFTKTRPMYASNRGGILAETMGLGKTVICLATILTTRHHLPKIPPQYSERTNFSNSVPSLLDVALSTAGRFSIPVKAHFNRIRRENGQEHIVCLARLDEIPPTYYIPGIPPRNNRRSQTPPPKKMTLCSGTIIVVPRNLLHQWKAEIRKHIEEGEDGLKILVLDGPNSVIPTSDKLRHYDIVLFSKPRFQKEISHGRDQHGRNTNNTHLECHCPYVGATRVRDCICLKENDIYISPLQELHWLRIIIDEGHEFSSATSDAVIVSQKLVTADRRWIVSGTPARDKLYGIEVDIATDSDLPELDAANSNIGTPDDTPATPLSTQSLQASGVLSMRSQALQRRKQFNRQEEVGPTGAAKNIGTLVGHFLQVRPWAHEPGEPKVEWDDHIYRHESYRMRTYKSFSGCYRRVMESLVIKTRPEDVEKDIVLPPLTHNVIRLEPSFYDKLTANLFVLFLTSNAVCSERLDQDYLFHKNSAKARHQLITNLRQSNFFWTGFSAENVTTAVEISLKYLGKEDIKCPPNDRQLLISCIEFAQIVLDSPGWLALSRTHEVAMFLNSWPNDTSKHWSLTEDPERLIIGAGPLASAQRFVNERLFEEDPLLGLDFAGKAAMMALGEENKTNGNSKVARENLQDSNVGVPSSAVQSGPLVAKRHSMTTTKIHSPQKLNGITPSENMQIMSSTESPSKHRKRKRELDTRDLPKDSLLRNTSIVGTVSAKLSYLLDQIVEFHGNEKIIVFYDGNNAAYYLAQCLDLLHIKHLIYAKSLTNEQKSKYIVSFDSDDTIRVLLMDIRSGAFGLNVNKASRVYFINPVCRPSAEAQAIKRAHRIGQTRPVHVETLILKGTMEEAMFERSSNMTQIEHFNANQLEDDQGVASIIQNAQNLPVTAEEGKGPSQMAPLKRKVQLFGRKGRGDTTIKGIDKDVDPFDGEAPSRKKPRIAKPSERVTSSKERGVKPLVHHSRRGVAGGSSSSLSAPPVQPIQFGDVTNAQPTFGSSTFRSIFGP